MKRFYFFLVVFFVSGLFVGMAVERLSSTTSRISFLPNPTPTPKPLPLLQYTIPNLAARSYTPSQIVLEEPIATESAFTVVPFSYESDGKKVTGLAHIPAKTKPPYPVIVQFRGFVPQEIYKPGVGTARSAEVYASNGFLSLAPDFLGYGGSASPSADTFEDRFQTYTTAVNLISSISTLPIANPEKIGIWGHSNGGHIALTVLEILGKPIPTTLWAPVSQPFPYSILFYSNEADDKGKAMRKVLSQFEEDYNVDEFTLANYFDKITAPIQLHQGTADDAVPVAWSDDLAKTLKAKDKDIKYYTYPGADHNMLGAWNTVVERDIEFFKKELKIK
jgi:uncharacterized protein